MNTSQKIQRAYSALVVGAAITMTACTSQLTGVGADGSFKCGRAEGIPCTPMHVIDSAISNGSIADLRNGVDPSRATGPSAAAFSGQQGRTTKEGGTQGVEYVQPRDVRTPWSGIPVRTPEKVLRVLFFPYLDADNDLHDQKYIYVTVAGGDWTLDASRFNPRSNVFRTIYPLQVAGGAGQASGANAANGGATAPTAAASSPFPTGEPASPSLLQKAKQAVDGTVPSDSPAQ